MISRLIQQKVPLGNNVKFSLKNGHQISGVLTEITREYVTVENSKGPATILVETIAAWESWETVDQMDDSRSGTDKPQELENNDNGSLGSAGNDTKYVTSSDTHAAGNGHLSTSTSVPAAVWKKVIEVEATYNAQISSAKIEVAPPDFEEVSKSVAWQNASAISSWNSIKNQYDYAVKVNELSAKFGRIQPIVIQVKNLVESHTDSVSLKRCLAYLYSLLDTKYSRGEAIRWFHAAATESGEPYDWMGLAAIATQSNKDAVACYALQQFCLSAPLNLNPDAWYSYVGLVRKYNNYPALRQLIDPSKRSLTHDDINIIFDAGLYLLSSRGNQEQALFLEQERAAGQDSQDLLHKIFEQFVDTPPVSYSEEIQAAFASGIDNPVVRQTDQPTSRTYIPLRKISSPVRPPSAVSTHKDQVGVTLESKKAAPSAADYYMQAVRCSYDPARAITYIKKCLATDPDYPGASALYEKLREQARVATVPAGSNPYARAKQAHMIDRDLSKAAALYLNAVEQNDNSESALKDLSFLLNQLNRPEEAIEALDKHAHKIKDKNSVDNLYALTYFKAGRYSQAISVLKRRLLTAKEAEKAPLIWNLANCYIKSEDYNNAERMLREGLKLQPGNVAGHQNLASCLSKQGRYDEAIQILNRILDTSPNPKAVELLEAVKKAKTTGEFTQIDEIGIEFNLTDLHVELSGLTHFFLQRCNFEGINPEKLKEEDGLRHYIGTEKDAEKDIERLEEGARTFGSKVARSRGDFYLSAARISIDVKQDYDLFYRYLCRSFASKGDAAVSENLAIDTAREWYCESLNAYDGCLEKFEGGERYDEQDAVNALARFLFASLGSRSEIPTAAPKREREERRYILQQQVQYINTSLESVMQRQAQTDKVFDAIAYVTLRSKYAAKRLLNHLYSNESLRTLALDYLKGQGVTPAAPPKGLDDFVDLWNRLRRKLFEKDRDIAGEFRFLSNFILTTAWLEDAAERVKNIAPRLLFGTDRQRLQQIQMIFETALQLCREVTFEERERLCVQIDGRCQDLLREIETSPTKLSVEQLFGLVGIIQRATRDNLRDLYETSKPQIEIRLAKDSYPNISQLVEVQVLVANKIGLSPAESLKLFVHQNEELFTLSEPEISLGKSLRGDRQEIIRILLQVTRKALEAQAFSLTLSATYLTRTGEIENTEPHSFTVKLYSEEDFRPIENRYAVYAKGNIVGDPKMFYGRKEFIENISAAIQQSRSQSKSVIIYGQKRAGKSSILYHLKQHLSHDKSLLLLDIGNIAQVLDEDSASEASNGQSIGTLNRLLWLILRDLKYGIEERVENGYPPLKVAFPSVQEFFQTPSPRMLFGEVFDQFRRLASKLDEWREVRVVVLIDEFSYIHGQIVSGNIPETFPKYWKAILQANYFNAVLVGQDNTPKFFSRFKNEFASTQVERVTYLNPEDAVRLIDEPLHLPASEGGGSRYRERAIERILELTAGSPFYIQIFCKQLVDYMNNERSPIITRNDVEQVKQMLLSGTNRLDDFDFDNLINSGDTSEDAISDEDALKVLQAIAVNSRTGPCNRNSISCETQAPISDILSDLVRREVIEREREDYYNIKVGLFKEWLLANA